MRKSRFYAENPYITIGEGEKEGKNAVWDNTVRSVFQCLFTRYITVTWKE